MYSGAHPRSRGENAVTVADPLPRRGSSPLTRGKRRTGLPEGRRLGLIPAHAGKTRFASRAHCFWAAHPRSRGENEGSACGPDLLEGSSPLTRGKRVPGCEVLRDAGLIPAHAGKTPSRAPRPHGGWAHPRSRGENAAIAAMTRKIGGSSPLTRGKRSRAISRQSRRGLIPAHAGKTNGPAPPPGRGRAHPRSRGENNHSRMDSTARPGSSPLTRGKLRSFTHSG